MIKTILKRIAAPVIASAIDIFSSKEKFVDNLGRPSTALGTTTAAILTTGAISEADQLVVQLITGAVGYSVTLALFLYRKTR